MTSFSASFASRTCPCACHARQGGLGTRSYTQATSHTAHQPPQAAYGGISGGIWATRGCPAEAIKSVGARPTPPGGGGGGGANLVEGVAELIVGLGLELGLGRQCLPKKISKSVP
jgi:hypothetical protein